MKDQLGMLGFGLVLASDTSAATQAPVGIHRGNSRRFGEVWWGMDNLFHTIKGDKSYLFSLFTCIIQAYVYTVQDKTATVLPER